MKLGMEAIAAALLGIVQGLTEFLPISSSAHLILIPWFFKWTPEGLAFDVSLHVGTAVAVLAYFWADWVKLGREFILGIVTGRPLANQERKLAWLLLAATLPAVVAGLTFQRVIEQHLRSPLVPVATLVIFGIVLYWADRHSRQVRRIDGYTWTDALLIGFAQAVALVPGVSRSGITISAAMFRHSSRAEAARFSFLLSTPVIVGAGLSELVTLVRHTYGPAGEASSIVNWGTMATGTFFAAVTGFLCIRFFLNFLRTKGFLPFVLYRFILAAIVLMYYLR